MHEQRQECLIVLWRLILKGQVFKLYQFYKKQTMTNNDERIVIKWGQILNVNYLCKDMNSKRYLRRRAETILLFKIFKWSLLKIKYKHNLPVYVPANHLILLQTIITIR